MKKTALLFSFAVIFLAVVFLNSCASEKNFVIEKRHYENGYYIHHGGKNNSVAASEKTTSIAFPNSISDLKNSNAANSNSIVPATTQARFEKTIPFENKNNSAARPTSSIHPKHKHNSAWGQNAPVKKSAPKIFHANKKTPASGGDINLVLLVIIAILLPPLAVYLKEGITTIFWIDLICWLLGGGLLFGGLFYGSFLALLAVVLALLKVLDVI